ncbi:MAG: TonB-dependent receptor [bacterium]|nr:TonB-dependent receptor [bacterium]
MSGLLPLILLAYYANAADIAQFSGTATLVGTVVDNENNEPVGWCDFYLPEIKRFGRADEFGKFFVSNLPAGEYTLFVRRIGYREWNRRISLLPGDPIRLAVKMTLTPVKLAEIVVEEKANRMATTSQTPVLDLSGERLRSTMATTLAATLENEPGIALRTMGPAPARPVLRGLSGDRLLLLEDGSRTGDLSATAADHAVVIDPMNAERIEVLRGPAALRYGSNTLGGVINSIRENIPNPSVRKLHITTSTLIESVNRDVSSGIDAVVPLPYQVTGRINGNLQSADDLKTPIGFLQNTATNTSHAGIGISGRTPWGSVGTAFNEYHSEYGIPGGFIGAHPSGVRIKLYRNRIESQVQIFDFQQWIRQIEIKAIRTRYYHAEYEAGGFLGTEFGTVQYDGSLDFHWRQNDPLRNGLLGLAVEQREYATGGFVFSPPARERKASVILYQEHSHNQWTLTGAARFDFNEIKPKEQRISARIGKLSQRQFSEFSGGITVDRALTSKWTATITGMRTHRSPGIEELYSEGPHLAAYSYEVGNPELGSERAWGGEVGMKYMTQDSRANLTFFWNEIDAYIFPRNTGLLNPRTLLMQYQYTGYDARMCGGEAAWEKTWGRWQTMTSASYVQGVFRETGSPMPQIPPLSGKLTLKYQSIEWSASATVYGAWKQTRTAEFETSTSQYLSGDWRFQYQVPWRATLHTFTLSVENLLDTDYRKHLSRVKSIMPEAGRNVKLFYRMYF